MKLNTVLLLFCMAGTLFAADAPKLTDADRVEAIQKLLIEANARIAMLRNEIEIRDTVKFTAKYASGLCAVIAAENARSKVEADKCGAGFKLDDKGECVK
jgi:hypothetical protein